MRKITFVVLLVTTAASLMAVEVPTHNAVLTNPPSIQQTSQPVTEVWLAPALETMSLASSCPNRYTERTIVSYWGWVGSDGLDYCATICGLCFSRKIVGQEIFECDGTVTRWGRNDCTFDVRTTYEACEICEPPVQ